MQAWEEADREHHIKAGGGLPCFARLRALDLSASQKQTMQVRLIE
jgi:hypothetical protein